MALFSAAEWESIRRAFDQEIAEVRKGAQSLWLDIDAIEHVTQTSGRYVYRLLLSQPTRLEAEQSITFTTRGKDKVRATVISASDNELVVDCEAPLPEDARLQQVEFDPSFIYRALLEFLEARDGTAGDPADGLAHRHTPPPGERRPAPALDGLNDEQRGAVAGMSADSVHLLWGPPGTGKTTTLGAAVAAWMREGKSVLLVSTSNTAVDVAVKALLKRITPRERAKVLRLGTSTDPDVKSLTLGARFGQQNAGKAVRVAQAQERLRQISEIIATRVNNPLELQKLFEERRSLEPIVATYNQEVAEASGSLAGTASVFACTLARMVLDRDIRARQFDVVVVDEASMVSILSALAAATMTASRIVYAGDPRQLPPIVQSEARDAQHWFGMNIFAWLYVNESRLNAGTPMTLLRTQYRMTDRIGQLVSRLSYGDRLVHARNHAGLKVNWIDIPPAWQTRLWSVNERSYYQPGTIPILHALMDVLGGQRKEMLLLTPFRAQQALLAAMAFDLKSRHPEWDIRASTIHRSQGSERHTVVVDLTTHAPSDLSQFFEETTGELLFNVAISRAADRLVILGSTGMLQTLGRQREFWKQVEIELTNESDQLSADEVLEDIERATSLQELLTRDPVKGMPAICVCRGSRPSQDELAALTRASATRKLLVAKDTEGIDGPFISRTPTASCMPLFAAHGYVALPDGVGWLVSKSPAVNKVLWRIGFGHLADEEVNPNEARRFFCPRCVPGNLLLRRTGEGWFLMCSEYPKHCQYTRRLSLEDAKAKVRLQGLTCPSGHPLTARTSAKGQIFLGCENYPRCEFTSNLQLLVGV